MKRLALLLFLSTIVYTQSAFSQTTEKIDSLGLPGDNLNLYSVLDLFQKSETFEAFEKSLNAEDSKINNLDLNNDDKTDYIKVIDHQTGESHAVVLQVMVNEKENQDVAVIEIEKDKEGKVVVQIVGNEELYGKDYIVEPTENDPNAKTAETKTPENEKTTVINNTTNNYYNTSLPNTQYVVVNQWPIVHYVYGPSYVVYASPWYWGYYPGWWNPWSPWYWHNYYWHHHNHYHGHHYGHYHRTAFYRAPFAHNNYGPYRSVSITVHNHRTASVYNKTYASKSRSGDGKIAGGKTNPAYNSKAEKNTNTVRNNKNDGVNKSTPNTLKPNGNRPSTNNNNTKNKPSNGGGNTSSNKTRPKAISKPAQKSTSAPKSSGKKGGGGKGR